MKPNLLQKLWMQFKIKNIYFVMKLTTVRYKQVEYTLYNDGHVVVNPDHQAAHKCIPCIEMDEDVLCVLNKDLDRYSL